MKQKASGRICRLVLHYLPDDKPPIKGYNQWEIYAETKNVFIEQDPVMGPDLQNIRITEELCMAHGGDIYTNKVDIDLSVNINPYPLPSSVRKAMYEALLYEADHYPDPECRALRTAIGEALHLQKEKIVCGDGASQLLMAAVHALKPERALTFAPGYVGYQHALEAVGCLSECYPLKAENGFEVQEDLIGYIKKETDLAVFANPNNPTGRILSRDLLRRLIERAEETGTWLMVDESYLMLRDPDVPDPWEDLEEVLDSHPHLILLRAFTKSFAIPGIRLGYVLSGNKTFLDRLQAQLPEWNVSVIAQKGGVAAAGELETVKEQAGLICREKKRFQEQLRTLGMEVFDSEANYFLVRSRRDLYQELLDQGILIRRCDDFAGLDGQYFRFGVRTQEESEKVLAALEKVGAAVSGRAGQKGTVPQAANQDLQDHKNADIREAEQKTETVKEYHPGAFARIEHVLPADIERNSFRTIGRELALQGRTPGPLEAPVTMRLIHTSADFEYADTVYYSENAVETAWKLIESGADIVTDTNMALAGINKTELAKYGGEAHCFMALPETARRARELGSTRAAVCMQMAAELNKPVIFAIGNAPTALIELRRMYDEGIFRPAFVIGMPVGFVNVVVSKELIMETDIPCIINRGRKGGSNVAAATCNALLYSLRDRKEKQQP